MEKQRADLEMTVAFVTERVSEEAERSGAPLDEDEKYLLHHLPTEPTNPTIASGFDTADEDSWPTPVLRDFRFERLCKLAKDAYLHDLQTRPAAAREWEFAAAVVQLNGHPVSWLLGWAGIRTAKRRAGWDRLFLAVTATLVVILSLFGALALSILTDGKKEVWKWTLWVAGGCGYSLFLTLLYFAVRRLEMRQREQNVERYRCDLSMHGSERAKR
jgi:hypothetical protein